MSERHTNHNGRDLHGNHKVRMEDVEDLQLDPEGADHFRDDVRLGGAVADTSYEGAKRGKEISELVNDNRTDVKKTTQPKRS